MTEGWFCMHNVECRSESEEGELEMKLANVELLSEIKEKTFDRS